MGLRDEGATMVAVKEAHADMKRRGGYTGGRFDDHGGIKGRRGGPRAGLGDTL